MPTATSSPQTAVINALLYVVGGSNAGDIATNQVYDPSTNSWTTRAPLPTTDSGDAGRYNGVADSLGGKLYLAGGWRTSPPLPTSSLLVYDPGTNSWITKSSMPILSACSSGGFMNGLLYVLTPCNGYSGYYNYLYAYNPSADSWTAKASAPQAHANAAYAVINGKLAACCRNLR